MDKGYYILYKYLILQPAYVVAVLLIMNNVSFNWFGSAQDFVNFWARFGLILLVSLITFIIDAGLKKSSNQMIMKNSKEGGEIIMKNLVKALILSGAVVGVICAVFTGSDRIVTLEKGWLSFNMYYLIIYGFIYLVSIIIVNVLTSI